MKVSIVIPVYNVEPYLGRCLDSVLAQEFQDFEVILADDGSTDSSGIMCDEYAEKDSRIQVIHKENGGLSSARNAGVRASRGDYIYFVDSDDCIHPKLLEKTVEIAEETGAGIVQVDIARVGEDFALPANLPEPDYEIYRFSAIQAFYNLDRDDQKVSKDIRLATIVVWTKLYRRDIVLNVPFPEEITLHEDQMVAHRMIAQAEGMVFYSAPLYFYRIRGNSLITEGWTPKRLTILDCYRDRLQYAKRLPQEPEEKDPLAYYIYVRYLICMFKNYMMACEKTEGEEQDRLRTEILERFRFELYSQDIALSGKDALMFRLFSRSPGLFIKLYRLGKKIKDQKAKRKRMGDRA